MNLDDSTPKVVSAALEGDRFLPARGIHSGMANNFRADSTASFSGSRPGAYRSNWGRSRPASSKEEDGRMMVAAILLWALNHLTAVWLGVWGIALLVLGIVTGW